MEPEPARERDVHLPAAQELRVLHVDHVLHRLAEREQELRGLAEQTRRQDLVVRPERVQIHRESALLALDEILDHLVVVQLAVRGVEELHEPLLEVRLVLVRGIHRDPRPRDPEPRATSEAPATRSEQAERDARGGGEIPPGEENVF